MSCNSVAATKTRISSSLSINGGSDIKRRDKNCFAKW